MTKQDILALSTSREIMKALAANRDLWDEDLDKHLRNVKRKENAEMFGRGEEDTIYRPAKRENA